MPALGSLPVLLGLTLAAQAGTEAATSYLAQVERYRRGETEEVVKEVSRWPGDRLRREADNASREVRGGLDFPVAAAAMLHTDCARLSGERSDLVTFDARMEEAAAFVRLLEGHPEGASFARRWYEAVGYDLMGWGDIVRARRFLEDGLRRFPGDPALRLALGSLAEMEGSPALTPLSARSAPQPAERRERQGRLRHRNLSPAEAEGEYRRALEADPELGEAHLRRGRVLAELGRAGEALPELEWVRQRSRDPYLLYLTFLFQGRIQEQAGRLEAATACYRSATAQDPAGQTGYLALGHALDLMGDGAGAVEALRHAAPALPRAHDDGWWLYRFGRSHRVGVMLDELRREATR